MRSAGMNARVAGLVAGIGLMLCGALALLAVRAEREPLRLRLGADRHLVFFGRPAPHAREFGIAGLIAGALLAGGSAVRRKDRGR